MITHKERVEFRKAFVQYDFMINLIEDALTRDVPLSPATMLGIEKMTNATELPQQLVAMKDLRANLNVVYDDMLRYAAQFRLSPFCEYMFRNEPPALHHEFLIDHLEAVHNIEIMRLAISMPPGSAKALALDTPIPTPDGWKNIGNLKAGDIVFDENGLPCNVTSVSPVWRDRPVYAVTTDCGDTIIADKEHEWNVRLCGNRPVHKIKETQEIYNPTRAKRPMIIRAKALELPEVPLPIDPYLLGLWLGDGTASCTAITSDVEDQKFVKKELIRLGYSVTDRKRPTVFSILGVRSEFIKLGLIHNPVSNDFGFKHIPESYMRSSKEQRLHLLQGLIDSDGTICKESGCTTFCNTNRNLADGVRELVRSLGVKAGWSESYGVLNGVRHKLAFKVSFYLKDSSRLPRKRELTRDQYRTPDTYIDIEPAGLADTVCISVDSPSHLFLCGRSMTPTHNSSYASIRFAAWHLGRRPDDRWLQGAHTQTFAKDRLGKPVRNLIADVRYKTVFPDMALSATSSAADYFEFTQGAGYYKACGVGVAIAGFRAEIAAIDDPIASREDAESPTMRKKLHSWFEDDFGTRPMPGSPLFVVATRWHEDDLIGHELAKMAEGASDYPWEVINIPALAVEDDPLERPVGEGLWPEVFGTEWYAAKRRGITGRSWNSLYQGVPTDEEGGVLKRADVSRYTVLPKDKVRSDGTIVEKVVKRITLSIDAAEKVQERNDWTAATVWIETLDKLHYLAHAVRTKMEFAQMTGWIEHLARTWSVSQILVEDRGAGTQYIQVRKVKKGFAPVIPINTKQQTKWARFDGVTPMFAAGEVLLPKLSPWIAEVENELFVFPNAKNDDYVDSISQYLAHSRTSNVKRGTARVNTGFG